MSIIQTDIIWSKDSYEELYIGNAQIVIEEGEIWLKGRMTSPDWHVFSRAYPAYVDFSADIKKSFHFEQANIDGKIVRVDLDGTMVSYRHFINHLKGYTDFSFKFSDIAYSYICPQEESYMVLDVPFLHLTSKISDFDHYPQDIIIQKNEYEYRLRPYDTDARTMLVGNVNNESVVKDLLVHLSFYFNMLPNVFEKSINIDGEKFTKAELMQIYLNGLSPDNNDHMLKHGAILKRGDKQIEIKYTEDFSNKVANSLTKEEIDFTYDLFTQGYNGTTKKILNDYSERNYGYSLFNESGYVHRSMTGLNYEASNDGFRQRAGALGSTIAKKRVHNSAPILIKDILTSYDNYASLVADYVSLDPVRKVNRIVNQRDENNKSIMSYFDSDKSGGGGRFIRNWLDTINGINRVRGEGGKIATRLMANAVLTPIEMNIGTMMKMYIDPLRFPATTYNGTQRVLGSDGNYTEVPVSRRVGWGSYITGVVRGFFSRMAPSSVNILDASGNIMYEDGKPVTKKAVDIFKETSSYYIRANEKGSIQNRYYLNNVFSNNMSRVQNFLSKGLEFAQNDMMTHMAFPVMQQFAKNLGYGDINSYENTTKAVELFDTLAMTTLSNGDNLDVSDLRSSNSLVRFLSAFLAVIPRRKSSSSLKRLLALKNLVEDLKVLTILKNQVTRQSRS
jgi:hypothetical protein